MPESTTPDRPLAYDAYELLADDYAALLNTKPHNAYYEWPAMASMWPDLRGQHVLDAGCGPGAYAERLLERGAVVTAIDCSDRMLTLARERLGSTAAVHYVDMAQPMSMFADASFDFVNAPLCFDYIDDWRTLFRECFRMLRPGGAIQFSCGHPAFDAEYFRTQAYFTVERVSCTWSGFGPRIVMPSVRRSLQEILMPVIEAGFRISAVVEPLPTEDFRKADPKRYATLMHRPSFLCVQANRL